MDAPPLVMVVWEDAAVIDAGAWTENRDHDYRPRLFHQVGFLLAATDAGVILTSAWSPETVAARDQIPRGMVRSITPLQPAPQPRKRRR